MLVRTPCCPPRWAAFFIALSLAMIQLSCAAGNGTKSLTASLPAMPTNSTSLSTSGRANTPTISRSVTEPLPTPAPTAAATTNPAAVPTTAPSTPLETATSTEAPATTESMTTTDLITSAEPTTATTSTAAPPRTTAPPATIDPALQSVTQLQLSFIGTDSLQADFFSDPDEYNKDLSTIQLFLHNDTWTSEVAYTIKFSVTGYEDPLGATVTPEIYPTISFLGSYLNLTFIADKCFTPKFDNVLTFSFSNDSATSGLPLQPVDVTLLTDLDQSTSASGVIITGLAMGAITFIFLMDGWCQAIVSLLQLQSLVALAQTNCAPHAANRIFRSSVWVLWPLSEKSGGSTHPVVQGRMVLNFVFVFGTFFIQVVALLLFGCFSKQRTFAQAKVTVRFPAASIIVALCFFQGSMFACWNALALRYLGLMDGNTLSIIALAVFTLIFLVAQLMGVTVSVFKLVSKQVFKEDNDVSMLTRIVYGGSWQDSASLAKWGVLYADLNGSSFWYMAINLFLLSCSATFSGFVPGERSTCTKQYFCILAANATNMVIMFLRRPFKSMFLNFLNLSVSSLMMLVTAAFATAMTCSRKGETFSATSAWLLLAVIFFKSLLVLVAMIVHQLIIMKKEVINEGIIPKSVAPSRRKLGEGNGVVDFAADDELSAVFPLEERKEEDLVLNVAYKPSLPHPVVVGGCIASREVGFGSRGGLAGSEGPSVSLQLSQPYGICADNDHLYICDSASHRILKHNLASRRLSTLVGGHGPGYSGDNANQQRVKLNNPKSICIGQRCLLIADTENDCVRRLDFASNHIHTIVGGTASTETVRLARPFGITVLGHALFISDSLNHRVVMYDLEDGVCRVVAGTGYVGFDADGTPAAASRLSSPQGIAINRKNGMLYIADTGNHRVVCLDPVSQRLYTVIGVNGVAGEKKAARGAAATFHPLEVTLCLPTDVCCLGDGSLLVVDGGNAKIWHVSPFQSEEASKYSSFRNSGERSAYILLPPNDHLLPRCICPAAVAAHTGASHNELQAAAGKKHGESPPLAFFASDSVNNMICYIDGSSGKKNQEMSFQRAQIAEAGATITHKKRFDSKDAFQHDEVEFTSPFKDVPVFGQAKSASPSGRSAFDPFGSPSAVDLEYDMLEEEEKEAARIRSDLRDPTISHRMVSVAGPGKNDLKEDFSAPLSLPRRMQQQQSAASRRSPSMSNFKQLVNPYTGVHEAEAELLQAEQNRGLQRTFSPHRVHQQRTSQQQQPWSSYRADDSPTGSPNTSRQHHPVFVGMSTPPSRSNSRGSSAPQQQQQPFNPMSGFQSTNRQFQREGGNVLPPMTASSPLRRGREALGAGPHNPMNQYQLQQQYDDADSDDFEEEPPELVEEVVAGPPESAAPPSLSSSPNAGNRVPLTTMPRVPQQSSANNNRNNRRNAQEQPQEQHAPKYIQLASLEDFLDNDI